MPAELQRLMADPIDPALVAIVRAIAETARVAWEPIWPVWKRVNRYPGPSETASADCCIPSSFALRDALRRTVPELRWQVVGGRPTKRTPAGGFLDANGVPHPHLWVEGRRRRGCIVADITADQFGGDAVLISENGSACHTPNATTGLLDYYEKHEAVTIEIFMAALDAIMQHRAAGRWEEMRAV